MGNQHLWNAELKCNKDLLNDTVFAPALEKALQLAFLTPKSSVPQMVFLSDGDDDRRKKPSDQLIQEVGQAFQDNCVFIQFLDAHLQDDLEQLAHRFGKKIVPIQQAGQVQEVFAHITVPEMI